MYEPGLVPFHHIKGVRLVPMTSDERQKLAVKEITNTTSFDALFNSQKNGLYDAAFGCLESLPHCPTCELPFASRPGSKAGICPGHFGIINLPLPVYAPLMLQHLAKLLKLKCWKCPVLLKQKKDCVLFVKQMQALGMGLVSNVERLAEIAKIFCPTKKNKKDKDISIEGEEILQLREELDKCLLSGSNDDIAPSKIIEGVREGLYKQFTSTKNPRCHQCKEKSRSVRIINHCSLAWLEKIGERPTILKAHPMTPVEVRKGLRDLWDNESEVLKCIFPMLMRDKDIYVKEEKNELMEIDIQNQAESHHHPTDIFFLDSVLAIPNRSRPPNFRAKMTSEDELTTSLHLVVQCAITLKTSIAEKKPVEKLDEEWKNLQFAVNGVMDSNLAKILKSKGKGIKNILEKKEGLMRMHIMGKRVNYAARSVITPDPYMGCDEVGVPKDIAMKLFYDETVLPRNLHDMRLAVINGPNKFPGALSVISETGRSTYLESKSVVEREGVANQLLTPTVTDGNYSHQFKKVRRHLRNGDVLILNRQPTLHKPSMQGFKVKILEKGKSLKINYSACKAFNADFDGDEMNAHLPQDECARVEGLCLVTSTEQYLVPKDGKPIAGLIQDHVIAGVLMTVKGRYFTRKSYYDLVFSGLVAANFAKKIKLLPPSIIKPITLWSGKQVFSTLLINLIPEGKPPLNMKHKSKVPKECWGPQDGKSKKNKSKTENDGNLLTESDVLIIAGELLSGVLDKNQFGSSADGLVHWCYELYGGEVASKLLSCLARMFTYFLSSEQSFTMGIADVMITDKGNKRRKREINEVQSSGEKMMGEAMSLVFNDVGENVLELYTKMMFSSDNSELMLLDRTMNGLMNKYQDRIKDSCWPQNLSKSFPHNALMLMVMSGAKGSIVNCMQISCLLGQVDLEGSRPPLMYSGTTLAPFRSCDISPRASGFITDRFLTGLGPAEFFFHSMAGRDGLIDTTVKTSRSGYLQRCLIKHMESLMVASDGTIRDHDSSIIQFRYGGDGLDVTKISLLARKHFGQLISNRDAVVKKETMNEILTKVDSTTAFPMQTEIDEMTATEEESENMSIYEIFCRKNYEKAWESVCNMDVSNWEKKRLCSDELSRMFDELSEKKKNRLSKKIKKLPDPVISVLDPSSYLGSISEDFHNEVESYIKQDPDEIIKNGVSEEEVRRFLHFKYQSSLICPGEAVGLLAATSMGEQTTQMTLNTFHLAGHGAMNVTLGVPRLKEILMTASKTIKTPMITVPLLQIDDKLENEVQSLVKKFRKIPLKDVLKTVKVHATKSTDGYSILYKIKFRVKKPSAYDHLYSIKPPEVLKNMENKFFVSLINAIDHNIKALTSDKPVHIGTDVDNCGKSKRKSDDEGDENEDRNKNGDDDDGDNHMNENKDDDDDDETASDDEGEVDYSESDEDEDDKEGNAKDESDQEADDEPAMPNVNDDSGFDTETEDVSRKRKIKLNSGETIVVSEKVAGKRGKKHKTDKLTSREDRIWSVSHYPYVLAYDFDNVKGLWCEIVLQFSVKSSEINLEWLLNNEIRKATITQVPGITNCIMKDIEDKDTPSFIFRSAEKLQKESNVGFGRRRKKLVIEGTNIMHLYQYFDKLCIDELYTNDIQAVARDFGVHAAKKVLVEELLQVFKAYGIDIDHRYLSLISDYMTYEGSIKSFSRNGLESSVSFLQKMSYESALNFTKNAAIGASHDLMENASARIVVGQLIKAGTGSVELKIPIRKAFNCS